MRSLIFILILAGCGDTGQSMVSYPALAVGAPASVTSGAWTATLDVARVAIGPLYFCATATASESLCPAAVNELRLTAEADVLSPVEQPLGEVRGTTGTIHSAMFDWGITWSPTQPAARANSALGHSAHFEGHATRGAVTRRFIIDVDVPPQYQGSLAVNGARLTSPREVVDSTGRLRVRFDAAFWLSAVDFDELDSFTGDPIVLPPSSRAVAALANALLTVTPTFDWTTP